MLFLIYWELNEGVTAGQRISAVTKLQAAKLFPPPDVDVIRFDMTPDLWGVTTLQADSVADIYKHLGAWRVACPGMFKSTKVSPAMPVEESITGIMDVMKKLD